MTAQTKRARGPTRRKQKAPLGTGLSFSDGNDTPGSAECPSYLIRYSITFCDAIRAWAGRAELGDEANPELRAGLMRRRKG